MGKRDRGDDLIEYLQPVVETEGTFPAIAVDRHAVNVFHCQIWNAVVRRPGVEEACDVRVRQAGQDRLLTFKIAPDRRGVQFAAKHLDRHLLIKITRVALGQINGAHSACAEFTRNAVPSDRPSRKRIGGVIGNEIVQHAARSDREKAFCRPLKREQRLDLRAQSVAQSRPIKEGVSGISIERAGFGK